MTNTEFAELLLLRLYDLAESEGYAHLHDLMAIARQLGVTDDVKVLRIGKTLADRGLIQEAFTHDGLDACISGAGALLVEQGGSTGIIGAFRQAPGRYQPSVSDAVPPEKIGAACQPAGAPVHNEQSLLGFVSYSHKDEELKEQLLTHLAPLRRVGLIDAWHDRRISAGERFGNAISCELNRADIILLLVSSDFINSDYCYTIELQRAMERHQRGEAVVIPVILRPCSWHGTAFGSLLATPRDGKAVTSWANRDEAFHQVAEDVRNVANRLAKPSWMPAAHPNRPATVVANLRAAPTRLPRTFSEKDRDDFLEEAFGHIAALFENSLGDLERENPGVQTRFRRLDAVRLTAVAYRSGRAVSRCTVWMGGRHTFVGGIAYVENDSGNTDSFNETLSVEFDQKSLYLKPMGMPLFGQGTAEKMDAQAAGEYLWSLFLRPLQQGM